MKGNKAPKRRRKTKGKFVQKQIIITKKKKMKKKKVSPFAKFIPKKTKFIRAHKIKTPLVDWKNTVTKSLYNGCALIALRAFILNEKHMEIIRLRLVRELNKKIATDKKRSKILRDRVWSRINTSVPFTKKSIGIRMGKGKGGVHGWRVQIPAGRVLIETASLWKKKEIGFSYKIKRLLGAPSFIRQKLSLSNNRFNVIKGKNKNPKSHYWKIISRSVIKRKLRVRIRSPKLIVYRRRKKKVRFIKRWKIYRHLKKLAIRAKFFWIKK